MTSDTKAVTRLSLNCNILYKNVTLLFTRSFGYMDVYSVLHHCRRSWQKVCSHSLKCLFVCLNVSYVFSSPFQSTYDKGVHLLPDRAGKSAELKSHILSRQNCKLRTRLANLLKWISNLQQCYGVL